MKKSTIIKKINNHLSNLDEQESAYQFTTDIFLNDNTKILSVSSNDIHVVINEGKENEDFDDIDFSVISNETLSEILEILENDAVENEKLYNSIKSYNY